MEDYFPISIEKQVYFEPETQGFIGTYKNKRAFIKVSPAGSVDDFKEEVRRFQAAANLHLAPALYDYGFIESIGGVIITEYLDTPLSQILKDIWEHIIDVDTLKLAVASIRDLDKTIYKMCVRAYQAGIAHADLHSDNIFLSNDQIYIIDWELRPYEDDIEEVCESYKFTKQLLGKVMLMSRDPQIQKIARTYYAKL